VITSIIAGVALLVCALIELLAPGNDLYHYGWFNVLLAALIVLAVLPLPKTLRAMKSRRARVGFAAAVAGCVIAGFTTIASGLLGPDAQMVVAAPGASVRVDEIDGSLVFPIASANGASQSDVLLTRGTHTQSIHGRQYVGPFLLEPVPRSVVSVDVTDTRGGHLTITQPTGNAFLSPVLLMQSQQLIAGMTVPYDSFAVPAAHRVVKTVLFSAEQSARLPSIGAAVPTVLFDVENENESEVKNGIGVARDGGRITLAGIVLQPRVFEYPAVRVISVPDFRIVALAIVLAVVGAIVLLGRFAQDRNRG
jgi:hypothetical protein